MAEAKKILEHLLARYPNPQLALRWRNPLELLVAVILSAQCTDARVNEVTRTLFQKYRRAEDYARADPAILEQEIRSTGFYKSKARAIIRCCQKLTEDFGGQVPNSLEALLSLPGVGRKTANMVLGNAFGVPGIAVDTHVARVSRRLGLTRAEDPEEIEQDLMRQIPRAKWVAFTNAMILHGRETCTARAPRCGECVLYALCAWKEKTKYRRAAARRARG